MATWYYAEHVSTDLDSDLDPLSLSICIVQESESESGNGNKLLQQVHVIHRNLLVINSTNCNRTV